MGLLSGLLYAVVVYLLTLIGVFVMAFIIDVLAGVFGARRNFDNAMRVSAYAPTAAWVVGVFNLIPAFPMDGGRVLRGILSLKMGFLRATTAAVFIGQGFSMFFIFYGLFFNWWLSLIGIFLFIGAGGEKQHVMLQSVLHRVSAGEVMAKDFHSLRLDDPLTRALEHIYHGCQQDFPIVGSEGIEGVLTRMGILAVIHDKGVNIPVSEVMDRQFNYVDPQTPLDEVYQYLLSHNKTTMPVLENGQLKGMISLDGISRYLMIQAALKGVQTA